MPNDCNQKVSHDIADLVVHSSFLAWISLFNIDEVLKWVSFSKIYALKVSFSKNFLQITDIKFSFNYKLAQSILRQESLSQYNSS